MESYTISKSSWHYKYLYTFFTLVTEEGEDSPSLFYYLSGCINFLKATIFLSLIIYFPFLFWSKTIISSDLVKAFFDSLGFVMITALVTDLLAVATLAVTKKYSALKIKFLEE